VSDLCVAYIMSTKTAAVRPATISPVTHLHIAVLHCDIGGPINEKCRVSDHGHQSCRAAGLLAQGAAGEGGLTGGRLQTISATGRE
jgi:hypothetical protein